MGWEAGEDWERFELEGRVVSVPADSVSGLMGGQGALIEFENDVMVVVQGSGMDRSSFVEAAKQIALTSTGEIIVIPPSGYAQVGATNPPPDIVTYRQGVFEGPNGGNAEVRIWSGTVAEVALQALNRVSEAQSTRATTFAGADAVVAYRSAGLSRVWVVGGDDGYVIEIDFNPSSDGASDADLDAVLSQVHLVDLATFEAALPEGAVTSKTMDAVVAEMLSDIPQPSGFDASAIEATGNRYHVGAEVAGAVTCAWIEQWIDATDVGDTEKEREAVDALLSSKRWSILLEMDAEGDYPEVVWEYAEGIAADGTVIGGRVLTVEESYRSAFGCDQ